MLEATHYFLEITPGRLLNHLYVYLDLAFLMVFILLLFLTKRKLTLLFALAGGIIYFIVDYGIFFLLLQTRVVEGTSYFWFLLWLSMSYGITNFAWIWLWIKKDRHLIKWTLLILIWWFVCPFLAKTFGGEFGEISIHRGTMEYHWVMVIFLVIGYAFLIWYNQRKSNQKDKNIIWWLLAIGILVQLGWEVALLVGGIRQGGLLTLTVNSLLETNMGIPYIYFIYLGINKRYHEDLTQKYLKE